MCLTYNGNLIRYSNFKSYEYLVLIRKARKDENLSNKFLNVQADV